MRRSFTVYTLQTVADFNRLMPTLIIDAASALCGLEDGTTAADAEHYLHQLEEIVGSMRTIFNRAKPDMIGNDN